MAGVFQVPWWFKWPVIYGFAIQDWMFDHDPSRLLYSLRLLNHCVYGISNLLIPLMAGVSGSGQADVTEAGGVCAPCPRAPHWLSPCQQWGWYTDTQTHVYLLHIYTNTMTIKKWKEIL